VEDVEKDKSALKTGSEKRWKHQNFKGNIIAVQITTAQIIIGRL